MIGCLVQVAGFHLYRKSCIAETAPLAGEKRVCGRETHDDVDKQKESRDS